ncbi:MAG: ATP-binding protein [Rhizomicrobium sp.]
MDPIAKNSGSSCSRAVSPATLAALIVLVYTSGVGSWALDQYTGQFTGIWIANAILVAILMRHRNRDWPLIIVAGFAANVAADTVGYGLANATIYSCINLLEILALTVPLRYFQLDRDFTRPNALLVFYALAIGPTPMLGALISAAYFHFGRGEPFFENAASWYAADALGLVLIVPALMTVRWTAIKAMFARNHAAWTGTLTVVMLATMLLNFLARSYPLAFLFFPAAMLLTFQRGFAGGMLGTLMAGTYLMMPALFGHSAGPLQYHHVHEQVMIVQIFIAVMGFSVVLGGAAREERRRLEQWLAAAISRAENSREEALVAKDAAEKASRSKSTFLANMSHELRTPLNAVIGFSEMMNGEIFGPLGDRRYGEYAKLIQGAGQHLLDLINDILDMSKIEAGKQELHREKLNLEDVIADSMLMVREQATIGEVHLETDMMAAPAYILADRRAMKQILLNLLSNAVKFTPAGGRVTVGAKQAGTRVVLSVSDTGVGIPADQIYRLGNPFVQIRNSAGTSQTGTGLGLALVRALAELHDGTFKIESVEGRGTTVSISLPTVARESLAA